MPRFSRRVPAPVVKGGYRKYLPFVREDFVGQCAYCLLSEILADGEENFELDHFRPKSRFKELVNDFYNIYYSCHPCNHQKHDAWPVPELEAKGISIADPCADEFRTHFLAKADGTWEGVTETGAYTIKLLRLNRKHLIRIRLILANAGYALHEERVDEVELLRLLGLSDTV